ncbi:MAG: LysR family transcriptional regulator [Candidatus Muiribacterium halophilum]|uniref:LysR family transcriptional regulator n=1 Tax=Muiribacterium halophilum TaxID=2053465 RepID=A0A2N5ZN83_MUIH1|nr:MAG: LysR family transcriptional regulator [Candidatus Muirbacterium halophilum]
MNITLRHLECFVETVKCNGVSKASEKLLISQSAVSISLNALEKIIGERLFDRSGRQLILNDVGRVFYSKAVEILERAFELENMFSNFSANSGIKSIIRLGASSTIGNYVIPDILLDFFKKHDDIRINMTVGNTEQIIENILNNDIDIGFIEGLCFNENIDVRIWMEDELVVFANKNLIKKMNIKKTEDLKDIPWILREKGSGTRDIFEREFPINIGELNVLSELGHSEAVKKAVKNNMGISCLSSLVVKDEIKDGLLGVIDIPDVDIKRNFYLIIRKDKYKSENLKKFIKYSTSPTNS